MAFKLTGVSQTDLSPETFSRDLHGERVDVQLLPLTAPMDRAAMSRAKVRADKDGMMILQDMQRYQTELAVEVFDSWTIENGAGQTAKITAQTVQWLMDYSDQGGDLVRDALARSREMYQERVEIEEEGAPN